MPTFSGKHSDWENFRDLFRPTVHRSEMCKSEDKLYYLHTHIKEKALEIAKRLKLVVENYDKIWKDLKAYYENPRRLVQAHLTEFFNVSPMQNDSYTALNKFTKEIFPPLDALESIGRPVNQWSDLLVFIISAKLDAKTLKEWQRNLGACTVPPTMKQLRKFLESQLLTLEGMESGYGVSYLNKYVSSTPSGKQTSKSNPQTHQSLTNPSPPKAKSYKPCTFCSGEHFIATCPEFRSKSIPDRQAFVESKQLCSNCLGDHPIKSCRSLKRCFICKRLHHTFLHNNKQKKPANQEKSMANEFAPRNQGYSNQIAEANHQTTVAKD